MELKDWVQLQEALLKSQLKVIREFLRSTEQPTRKKTGRSQMDVVYDVLQAAGKPLHVTEIVAMAEKDFGVQLDRETIVSALTKKVKSGRMFQRVAPNTFALVDKGET
ncbi:MAG: HTH domain-containing protein [Desulfoferrobacter sp.]